MVNALDNKKGFLLLALCLAQFTLSADVANLSISTSTLVSVFDADISTIQLLGSIQPLVGAAFMLSASMFGLIIGWRRLLITGACLGITSTCGFLYISDINYIALLVRPLAGISAAFMLPAILALVVTHFPGKQRAMGFGLMAAATGLAAAVVPLLSGWLHDTVQWQWPFILVATCYIFTLIAALFGIQPVHTNRPAKFDLFGTLIGSTSIMAVFLGLIKMPYWGMITSLNGADIPTWLTFTYPISPAFFLTITGLSLFICFIFQQIRFERRYGHALLPISWFQNRASRKGFIILSLMYIVLGGSSFVIVTYLQVAISLSSAHSGAIILLFSAFMIGFSILIPALFKHHPPKRLCQIAFLAIMLSGVILLLSSLDNQIVVSFYLGMMLLGAAMGTLASQCPVIITNALGERDAEQSGGLQATVRNIGLVVGISLFGGINQWTLEHTIRSNNEIPTYYPRAFVEALHDTPHIPYVDNLRVMDITKQFGLDSHQSNYLIQIKAQSRVKAFNFTMMTLITIALLGWYISLGVKSNKVPIGSPLPRICAKNRSKVVNSSAQRQVNDSL